jgi:hypothetical protein
MKNLTKLPNEFLPLTHVPLMIQMKTHVLFLRIEHLKLENGFYLRMSLILFDSLI